MGLFGFLSKDPKAAVEKQGKKLMNKYQQSAERKGAIEALTKIGTEDAVVALLKRYQYNTEQSIADEDEKSQVYECIVSLGNKAVPGINQYIRTETGLYWPVKALRALVGDEAAARSVLDALDLFTNTFGQNRERRQQLVDNLRNFAQFDMVFTRLLTLAGDEDEEVVIRAIDGLSAREGHGEHVEALVAIAIKAETSTRVRMMIFELMVEKKWVGAPEQVPAMAAVIPPQYTVDQKGNVGRR